MSRNVEASIVFGVLLDADNYSDRKFEIDGEDELSFDEYLEGLIPWNNRNLSLRQVANYDSSEYIVYVSHTLQSVDWGAIPISFERMKTTNDLDLNSFMEKGEFTDLIPQWYLFSFYG